MVRLSWHRTLYDLGKHGLLSLASLSSRSIPPLVHFRGSE
jgi:hypothetical protein